MTTAPSPSPTSAGTPTSPAASPAAPLVAERAEPADTGLVRAFAIGAAIGAVAVFAVFFGVATALGLGTPAAIGIGAFTAAWGGPGFGGMMGAVLHITRAERH